MTTRHDRIRHDTTRQDRIGQGIVRMRGMSQEIGWDRLATTVRLLCYCQGGISSGYIQRVCKVAMSRDRMGQDKIGDRG